MQTSTIKTNIAALLSNDNLDMDAIVTGLNDVHGASMGDVAGWAWLGDAKGYDAYGLEIGVTCADRVVMPVVFGGEGYVDWTLEPCDDSAWKLMDSDGEVVEWETEDVAEFLAESLLTLRWEAGL